MVLGLGDCSRHVGKRIDDFRRCIVNMASAKNVEEKRLLELCNKKQFYEANTCFQKKVQRKIIRNMVDIN